MFRSFQSDHDRASPQADPPVMSTHQFVKLVSPVQKTVTLSPLWHHQGTELCTLWL